MNGDTIYDYDPESIRDDFMEMADTFNALCSEVVRLHRLLDQVRIYRTIGADAPGTWPLWQELDAYEAAASTREPTKGTK